MSSLLFAFFSIWQGRKETKPCCYTPDNHESGDQWSSPPVCYSAPVFQGPMNWPCVGQAHDRSPNEHTNRCRSDFGTPPAPARFTVYAWNPYSSDSEKTEMLHSEMQCQSPTKVAIHRNLANGLNKQNRLQAT